MKWRMWWPPFPFHPWKYRYIKWRYGKQSSNCWNSTNEVIWKIFNASAPTGKND